MSDVERQRLCQERRTRGAVVIQRLVLSPAAIEGLIILGRLAAADRGNREAVDRAFVGFCKHALLGAQRSSRLDDRNGFVEETLAGTGATDSDAPFAAIRVAAD